MFDEDTTRHGSELIEGLMLTIGGAEASALR